MPDTSTKAEDELVLMTVSLQESDTSLAAAAAALGVGLDDLDAAFGVVPIDPDRGLHAVKVRQTALPRSESGKEYRGPYSNPKIASFAPSRKRG